mmetsp:Transcript_64165/g.139574  ORF Transcript_64165/g.139574 Transcript_64165/m.139574 type:complete len:234 (-) Transcript_64165:142-843(-)
MLLMPAAVTPSMPSPSASSFSRVSPIEAIWLIELIAVIMPTRCMISRRAACPAAPFMDAVPFFFPEASCSAASGGGGARSWALGVAFSRSMSSLKLTASPTLKPPRLLWCRKISRPKIRAVSSHEMKPKPLLWLKDLMNPMYDRSSCLLASSNSISFTCASSSLSFLTPGISTMMFLAFGRPPLFPSTSTVKDTVAPTVAPAGSASSRWMKTSAPKILSVSAQTMKPKPVAWL